MVAGKTRLRHYLHGAVVALETGCEGEVGKGSVALREIGNWGAIAGVAAIIFFAGTAPAQAYLDPGTGSIILQAIIGAIAGAIAGTIVTIRIYWDKIKSFLKSKNNGDGRDNGFEDRK